MDNKERKGETRTVTMSDKQLGITAMALEFYSRFLAGQVEVPDELRFAVKDRERLDKALAELKAVLFPELYPNESYGVGSPDNKLAELRQVSYEMYKAVYYFQNKDVTPRNVHSYTPLHYSSEQVMVIE